MKSRQLNIIEAGKLLEISEPTVKNWIKQNLLPEDLNHEAIVELKQKIDNHEIDILNKRANKTHSNLYFIPVEYTNNTGIISPIKKIRDLAFANFTDTKEFLFNAAICYLTVKQEFSIFFGFQNLRRPIVEKILRDYFPSFKISEKFYEKSIQYFKKLNQNNCEDVLGILYQSFSKEGAKSKHGSYYTPHNITSEINKYLSDVETYYDPCCGTGSFLMGAIKQLKIKAENVYGTDIDENAVFVAKINILLLFPDYAKEPNIFCNDIICDESESLKLSFKNKFDAIVTNPPWGAAKNEDRYAKYKILLNSNEIFSIFILMSISILKNSGEMIFLLPTSILNIKTHSTIRQFILNNTKIVAIKEFGKTFSNVFTSVIMLHLRKEQAEETHKIKIENKDKKFTILQSDYNKNKDYIFDINTNDVENQLIEKIYAVPHKILKNNATWGLGIITGNNDKFLSDKKSSNNEAIIKGTDINYFYFNEPEKFINYDLQSLQQVAKEEIYRSKEKLVYKFISVNLVFAYDNNGYLTLNSANCLIPDIKGHSIKTVLAFLNSNVFQYIFNQKFSTHKILRNDLETLPFPDITETQKTILEKLSERAINKEDIKCEIDAEIYKIFNLNTEDIETIERKTK